MEASNPNVEKIGGIVEFERVNKGLPSVNIFFFIYSTQKPEHLPARTGVRVRENVAFCSLCKIAKQIACYHYEEMGHFIENCPKLMWDSFTV